MNNSKIDSRKTDETRTIEAALRAEFPSAEAYRYNWASIRIRVIDERFRGLSIEDRDRMVSAILDGLPSDLQNQIILLLTLTPEEAQPENFNRHSILNLEFEDPSPSLL